jgi:hypothetical protein
MKGNRQQELALLFDTVPALCYHKRTNVQYAAGYGQAHRTPYFEMLEG